MSKEREETKRGKEKERRASVQYGKGENTKIKEMRVGWQRERERQPLIFLM